MNAPLRPDFTFSKAALTETDCRWWLVPGAVWVHVANEFTEGGAAVHRPLAVLVRGGKLELPEKPQLRAMYGHGKAWLEEKRFIRNGAKRLVPSVLRAEVAFAYDLETRVARELADPPGLEGTRWYADEQLRAEHGIRPSEVCGRLDLVGQGIDERGMFGQVDDYKCHFSPEWTEARPQLELGALALARTYGFERVKVTGVHLWEDREPLEEEYELDSFDLDTVAVRLDELAHPRAANDPVPQSGAHCKALRCPARASCPVGGDVVEEIVPLPSSAPALVPAAALVRRAPHPFLAPIATNEQAAWTLVAIDLLEELVAAKKAEAKAFADAHEGIVQSDGKVYSGEPQTRVVPDLSVPGATRALEDLGLTFALKTSTTWSAIKEAAGVEGEKKARAALGALGAVKTSQPVVYMARAPKKAASAKRAS